MIDLKTVIKNNPKCLESRATLRSLLKDLYPKDKRTIHVLLDAYESGVVGKFRNLKQISEMQMESYITQLVDEYGLQRQYAQEGIEVWTKALNISVIKSAAPPIKPVTPPRPTNPSASQAPSPSVDGDISDYKLKTLPDGSVEIEKFVGFEQTRMVVPSTISGKRVKGIGESAYKKCLNLHELIINEGIEYIGSKAFNGCENLESFWMPDSVIEIGIGAFAWCGRLNKVRLSQNLKLLGSTSFRFCAKLEKIILPEGLENISSSTFEGCNKLKSISFSKNVKKIESRAFWHCKELKQVELSEGIEIIETGAFESCQNLLKISFPKSLKRIESNAFAFCEKLNEVNFSEGVETIAMRAFDGCNLKEVLLPNSLVSIGARAFYNSQHTPHTPVFVCYRGSKGLQYAREKGIRVADAATWKNSTP